MANVTKTTNERQIEKERNEQKRSKGKKTVTNYTNPTFFTTAKYDFEKRQG
jgi:hypothetical protein